MYVVIGLTAWVVAVVLGGVGCDSHPIVEPVTRTPYDRYQYLHGEGQSRVVRNAYGREEVNLRERLRPLDGGY